MFRQFSIRDKKRGGQIEAGQGHDKPQVTDNLDLEEGFQKIFKIADAERKAVELDIVQETGTDSRNPDFYEALPIEGRNISVKAFQDEAAAEHEKKTVAG